MTILETIMALGGGIGLLWAVAPALTAPRASKRADNPDGFEFWPPCPQCGNIAVSCVGRYPVNEAPARAYTLRCDHDRRGRRHTGCCGHTYVMTRRAILLMQPKLKRQADRRLKTEARTE